MKQNTSAAWAAAGEVKVWKVFLAFVAKSYAPHGLQICCLRCRTLPQQQPLPHVWHPSHSYQPLLATIARMRLQLSFVKIAILFNKYCAMVATLLLTSLLRKETTDPSLYKTTFAAALPTAKLAAAARALLRSLQRARNIQIHL